MHAFPNLFRRFSLTFNFYKLILIPLHRWQGKFPPFHLVLLATSHLLAYHEYLAYHLQNQKETSSTEIQNTWNLTNILVNIIPHIPVLIVSSSNMLAS